MIDPSTKEGGNQQRQSALDPRPQAKIGAPTEAELEHIGQLKDELDDTSEEDAYRKAVRRFVEEAGEAHRASDDADVQQHCSKGTDPKDSKGIASDYQLKVISKFEIIKNNESEIIVFEEQINIKNSNNLFEKKKYENTIKITFAKSIVDKLIEKLLISE